MVGLLSFQLPRFLANKVGACLQLYLDILRNKHPIFVLFPQHRWSIPWMVHNLFLSYFPSTDGSFHVAWQDIFWICYF